MVDAPMGRVRTTFEDLAELLKTIFVVSGASEPNADILARNCAACERDGSVSHGVFRIPGYVASLKSGWVDGKACPAIEQSAPSMLRVDARNGFAQVAWAKAIPATLQMARQSGAVVVAIRDSHHFSALWPDLEPIADAGLVALSMVTGLACVAPYGGLRPVFGTNPIAFATPVAGRDPLIYDFATSAMSNGDLRLAARRDDVVPLGTGIDGMGNLTASPATILAEGALLPFGGHKGAAISMMVEILASALTGGQFSSEVDFSSHPGAETPKTGQIIIVIDPRVGSNQRFAERVRDLMENVRQAGQRRLPSDHRYEIRMRSLSEGIVLDSARFEQLIAMSTSNL